MDVDGWMDGVIDCMCSGDVEAHVVPVIMNLSASDSPDDFRADAVLASSLSYLDNLTACQLSVDEHKRLVAVAAVHARLTVI